MGKSSAVPVTMQSSTEQQFYFRSIIQYIIVLNANINMFIVMSYIWGQIIVFLFGVFLYNFETLRNILFLWLISNDYTLRLNLITPEYCFPRDFLAFLSKLEQDVKDIFAKNKRPFKPACKKTSLFVTYRWLSHL